METNVKNDRLVVVDALRGFALFGIMLAHFIYWYTAGPLTDTVMGKYQDVGSQIVSFINNFFISGKFFAFFSFLFGLSFYLQMQSLQHQPSTFVRRFSWRLFLLLVIGLIHHAFWMGDILSIYAPLGFILIMLRKLNNKWLLVLGLLLVCNVPGKIIGLVHLINHTQLWSGDFVAIAKSYDQVIVHGSLTELLRYNLSNLNSKAEFQLNSGRVFITMGFFLLGMYVGRKNWFATYSASKPVFTKILKRSLVVLAIAFICAIGMFAADAILKLGWQQNEIAGFVFMIFYDIFNSAMVAVIISGLTLLMYKSRGQKFFFTMAPVGKMALTSYIMQTVFGLVLFYNVGFGFYAKTSPAFNWLLAISFFVLQVWISKWWLQYFNYGPLEWLWRSGTLLKWQPLLKHEKVGAPVAIPAEETIVIS